MKKIILLILFILSFTILKSQSFNANDWKLMEQEHTVTLSFTKSETQNIKNISLKTIWNNKLSYSENIGYYGGISELHISENKAHIQTIKNIEDGIALGYINLTFYDYNMDGYLDFTIPIDCGNSCYGSYYLFNPQSVKFEHQKEWDYLRIQKLNKTTKQILSIPDGNSKTNEQLLYKVDGNSLIKIKIN